MAYMYLLAVVRLYSVSARIEKRPRITRGLFSMVYYTPCTLILSNATPFFPADVSHGINKHTFHILTAIFARVTCVISSLVNVGINIWCLKSKFPRSAAVNALFLIFITRRMWWECCRIKLSGRWMRQVCQNGCLVYYQLQVSQDPIL